MIFLEKHQKKKIVRNTKNNLTKSVKTSQWDTLSQLNRLNQRNPFRQDKAELVKRHAIRKKTQVTTSDFGQFDGLINL